MAGDLWQFRLTWETSARPGRPGVPLADPTDLMEPHELLGGRVRLDVALEVDVVAFLDVVRVETAAELQRHLRLV